MHLLATLQGADEVGSAAVDLRQSPGDILVLSAADTEIAALAAAQRRLVAASRVLRDAAIGAAPQDEDQRCDVPHPEEAPSGPSRRTQDVPSLRLARLTQLGHHFSVDLLAEGVASQARLIVVRILGGRSYWAYGVDVLSALCRERGIALALLPGDDRADPELAALSTLPPEAVERLRRYLAEGGPANAEEFLRYAASLIGGEESWREPVPLLRAGLYWPGLGQPALAEIRREWRADRPVALIVFYRALVQAANTAPVEALIEALAARGINPLPVFVQSLKDEQAVAILADILTAAPPGIVLNATGFAVSSPGGERRETPFDAAGCPVLQIIFAGDSEASWREGMRGLSSREIAMNVALPEVDGRVLARAVSFKSAPRRDPLTEADLVEYVPVADRIAFTAELALNWLRLREKAPAARRVAFILANYPNRQGRIGNGVGLDTAPGLLLSLQAMAAAGYDLGWDLPEAGDDLIRRLLQGPTNDPASRDRPAEITLSAKDYAGFFAGLPQAVRDKVTARWGAPEADPFFREAGHFGLPAYRLGNILIGLQPARGYNIDPVSSYHDPDLVPPHGYFAFYAYLRGACLHGGFDAVVHFGKHGNLEWLPGKAVALSAECFPEAVLGPLPHLYPFIVNDPGEGTQAKRRAQAVIIDHLMPPLTQAGTYGRLSELERLVDEYYEAASGDPRRLAVLGPAILDLVRAEGLDQDCGIGALDDSGAALTKLDGYLCEIKEMQIRGGLHVFGRAPEGRDLTDLLLALSRLPRGRGAAEASLPRALAADLGLEFDPLDCEPAQVWTGPRPVCLEPACLEGLGVWRSVGDTVERLEALARSLIEETPSPLRGEGRGEGQHRGAILEASDPVEPPPHPVPLPQEGERDGVRGKLGCLPRSQPVLDWIETELRPRLLACGPAEIAGLLTGLDGRFVPPGPSGAPSRGRPEVLPTGRNFYSVDSRVVPTPAAWQLGWKSAQLLVQRFAQDHGVYPRRLAVSAWGTSNMRTGGDDVAQALALIGARPVWETRTGRVTGFEILPASILDRPRVDVTFRVSGFFRDAFPNLIELVDEAIRAVAALDEPAEINPLAAAVKAERSALEASGVAPETAALRAGARVFGSKPGAYGAGLQAMIDERGWTGDADLAGAYLAWGGYAYGGGGSGEGGGEGRAAHDDFRTRLAGTEGVLHNQDNREHDILDSDDYYQFEGGLAVAVRHFRGAQPALYHNDHSNPESPRISSLEEEIGRIVRARAVNPKWIEGIMRHGYKGAFEIAATVDYLFAFAATARVVKDHHFDAVYEAYLADETVRDFCAANNPDALAEMSARLLEAIERGLWKPRRNSARQFLTEMSVRKS